MNTAEPIRETEELEHFKQFYLAEKYNPRNYLLVVMGLNTALRISDVLPLTWQDVYDFERREFRSHIMLTEQKTGKRSKVYMNKSLADSLRGFMDYEGGESHVEKDGFLFKGRNKGPLSRTQAWRIVRDAAKGCGIGGVISPHSMRKTFGYIAWKNGAAPALLMNIFNHSSFEITKRYLGIAQEDRDEVFRKTSI